MPYLIKFNTLKFSQLASGPTSDTAVPPALISSKKGQNPRGLRSVTLVWRTYNVLSLVHSPIAVRSSTPVALRPMKVRLLQLQREGKYSWDSVLTILKTIQTLAAETLLINTSGAARQPSKNASLLSSSLSQLAGSHLLTGSIFDTLVALRSKIFISLNLGSLTQLHSSSLVKERSSCPNLKQENALELDSKPSMSLYLTTKLKRRVNDT